jgi:hypothetical protein
MARPTETEKAEVLRFLERDKALPEKYRFLLFDDEKSGGGYSFGVNAV